MIALALALALVATRGLTAGRFLYFRPDGTSHYLRPDGTSLYLRR